MARDGGSRRCFYEELFWSLNALWEGRWPATNRRGDALTGGGEFLAGGYYGIVWLVKGDLEWYQNDLKICVYGSANPCCFCNTSNLNMFDFRPEAAAWLPTCWQDAPWLVHYRPRSTALFRLPGVSISSVCADLQHNKHLGVDCYFYGSVLKILVFKLLPGTAKAGFNKTNKKRERGQRESGSGEGGERPRPANGLQKLAGRAGIAGIMGGKEISAGRD